MTPTEVATRIETTKLQQRLTWYEDEIRKRGKSLAAIFVELRNDPLKPWKINHASYEEYCSDVWGMSPRRMQQLAAGETVKALLTTEAPDLAPVLESMPEGQLRELATTPPEQRQEVLRAAVTSAPKLTAKRIKLAKAKIIDATPEPEPKTNNCSFCPTCGQPVKSK